jgi:hypothetical protein
MSAINLSVFAHKNGLNAQALFIDILSKQNSSPHPLRFTTYTPNNTAFIVRPGSSVKSPVTMSARM